MNWNNIDMSSSYERAQRILNDYNIEDLLLEINCNLREINEDTVRKQFNTAIEINLISAKEVFEENIKNIVKEARRHRASNGLQN